MTLISTIITDAYRETNLIARGSTETVAEQTEALRLLDRYIQSLFGNEAGDNLMEVLFGNNSNIDNSTYNNEFETFITNWFMPTGYRLKLNLEQTNPQDGAMFGVVDASNNLATFPLIIDGNGSRIESVTDLTLNTNGFEGTWFYRADRANWQRVSDLLVTDESPFPKEFDDLLIIGLAFRLDPRNGSGINQASANRYQSMLRKFRARYSQIQERPLDRSLSDLDGNQRRYWRGYSLNGEFERGSIFRW